MACLCGDLYCYSCGPAQGNGRCYQCGAWALYGGCKDPKACEESERLQVEAEQAEYAREQEFWTKENEAQR